jgi:hypothetical protein
MTFPVVLFIAGALLLAIGLLGKIKLKEIEAGTESKPAKWVMIILGLMLMAFAYYVYVSDKKTDGPGNSNTSGEKTDVPTNVNKNVNQPSANQSASPSNTHTVFTINQPGDNGSFAIQVSEGTGEIAVKGTCKDLDVDFSKASIYLFTKTEGDDAWWYNEEVDPDLNGQWETTGLTGSTNVPTPKDRDKLVTIQAIVAKDEDVKTAISGNKRKEKFVKSLNNIRFIKSSNSVTVKIHAQ